MADMKRSIEAAVYWYCKHLGYHCVVPEQGYECWFADFIAWAPQKGILEIEIKRSWSDYRADANKTCSLRSELWNKRTARSWNCCKKAREIQPMTKYEYLRGAYTMSWKPTHFVFAAPLDLAKQIAADPDRPTHLGVWGVNIERSPYNSVVNLKRMRRLYRIQPEAMARFKADLFDRAIRTLDNHYWNLWIGH